MGGGRARRPAGQRDQARRRVLDRPRAHLLRPAAQAARAERGADGGREDALLPPLPAGRAGGASRRLQHRRAFADGARALAQRLPDGVERQPLHARGQGLRRAPREAGGGERRRPQPRPRRPGGRAGGARDELRRGRRARSAHGEAPGDGLVAELRPEPGREPLRADRADRGQLPAGGGAAEPGFGRPVRARLHVQGDHRGRRARVAQVQARLVVLRPRLLHGLREAREQLRHLLPVRHDRPRERARELRQLRLLQHGEGARREADPRHGQALRLLRGSPARDAFGRARAERAVRRREALLPEAGSRRRRGADGLRAGADARHAAPDGDGRGRARRRRPAPGAAGGQPDRRAAAAASCCASARGSSAAP